MNYLFLLAAVIAGAMLPIQGALNSRLGVSLDHPMQATLVSYLGGVIFCLVALILLHREIPEVRRLASVDWYYYCGGFLGAVFVSGMLLLMPKIGVTNMLAAAIVGQLLMSVFLDHIGGFGNPVFKITYTRIAGIALLLAGLYLIQRGD
ncbi:DMT family transporter [Pseudomaricurvus sp.]|uniref:DMT family transporter n=1 Tax=Pseudomaricurvus sp. TaxID=2004510 RepID=UPI003F6C932C